MSEKRVLALSLAVVFAGVGAALAAPDDGKGPPCNGDGCFDDGEIICTNEGSSWNQGQQRCVCDCYQWNSDNTCSDGWNVVGTLQGGDDMCEAVYNDDGKLPGDPAQPEPQPTPEPGGGDESGGKPKHLRDLKSRSECESHGGYWETSRWACVGAGLSAVGGCGLCATSWKTGGLTTKFSCTACAGGVGSFLGGSCGGRCVP
jgi:hypothetical protein